MTTEDQTTGQPEDLSTPPDEWPPAGRWLPGRAHDEPAYRCLDCGHTFEDHETLGSSIADECPKCGSTDTRRLAEEPQFVDPPEETDTETPTVQLETQ